MQPYLGRSPINRTQSREIDTLGADEYAAVILVVGLILLFWKKSAPGEDYGRILFSMGLVFYGLHQVGTVMEPLSKEGGVEHWLRGLEGPLWVSSQTPGQPPLSNILGHDGKR